jgi:hypothetical protein
VPGFRQYQNGSNGAGPGEAVYHYAPKTREEAAADPVFGESSIPDRVLSVPNLDIIDQQSAWGAVWLTRNRGLVAGRETSDAFIFQTPQVRFGAMVTPLLVNTTRWQIDAIAPADTAPRTLERHIELLFAELLPPQARRPYDLRVTVRYAFALAQAARPAPTPGGPGKAERDDLLSTLPVALGPRFTVPAGAHALPATLTFRKALAQTLAAWKATNRPLEARGQYIFSVAFFSSRGAQGDDAANLPLLQVEDLRLPLASIVQG